MRHQAWRIIQLPRRKLQILQPASRALKEDTVVGIALRPRRHCNNYVCLEETPTMLTLVTVHCLTWAQIPHYFMKNSCAKFGMPCRKKNRKFYTAGKLSGQHSQVYAKYFWDYESISEKLLEKNMRDQYMN